MTDTRKVQLASEVDSSGARKGFDAIKDAARDTAQVVGKAGQDAAKGIDGIGAGGEQAAGKLDRATKSIIGSIERTTAAMKAGERGTSGYFEVLANQRGANTDALKPYLDQLRQAEAAQRVASSGLDRMGVSAKQTAAALRGVPAQFTDIITSLQGGQAPLTVFLQQGGQLKDMFGGAGSAARALGGYVLGLVNPFTVAAAAGAGLAVAYSMGSAEAKEFQRTVILSGQVAGVTAGQLSDMAAAVRALGSGTQGRAAEVLNQMAASGLVGAGSLERFTAAALRLEQVGGPAAEETAKAFANLGKEPLAASLKLNESTNFLTASVYKQIKALEDQGRTVEAARVAQVAYADAVEQRSPQLLQTLGLVERTWLAIKSATKGAVDAALDIGRADTLQQQISAIGKQIAGFDAGVGNLRVDGDRRALIEAERRRLIDRQAYLQEQVRLEQRSADAAAQRAASVKAGVEWDKETDKYLTKQQQAAREIAKAEAVGLAAGKTRAEIEKQISAIRDKYADKATKVNANPFDTEALKSYAKGMEDLGRIALDASSKADELTKTQAKLREIQASPTWATYSRQQQEQILYAASLAQQEEDLAAATKRRGEIAKEAAKSYAQSLADLGRGGDSAEKQLQALRDEEAATLLVVDGELSLKQAIELVTIARLQEQQAAMMGNEAAVLTIQREIDARRELVSQIGGKESRDATRKWTDDLNKSLTDALLRGFESGKSFAENLRDTVVNMFKTMVLRPVVQAVVQTGTNYVTSALGLAQAANGGTAGSLGSLGSIYSAGSALYKAYGTAAAYFGGSAATAGGGIAAGGTYGTIGGTAGTYGSISGSIGTGSLGTGTASGASSAASSFAAAAPYVAAAIAAYAVSADAYSKGFTVQSVDNKFLESASPSFLTARLFNSLGIGSDKWNNIFSGASGLSRLFGRGAPQVTDSGISGSIGAGDFTGQAYRDVLEKGGWFRSDKRYTQFAALGDDINKYLDVASKSVMEQTKAFGAALGLPAEQLASVTTQVKIKIGADAEANKAAIVKALGSYTDALVATFAAQVEPLRQYGETTAQTIERVGAALTNANDILRALGQSTLAASVSGGQAAVALESAFGSADAFGQAAGSFLSAFYTDAERAAIATQQLSRQLGDLGVTTVPASREAYKALVMAQDLTTEGGRALYAALLQLSPAFASVAGVAEDLTAASAKAAQQVMATLMSDRGGLDVELLTAQGQGAQAKALARQQDLAKITAGLTATDAAAAIAAYDYNAAIKAQIDALGEAATAQQDQAALQAAIADQRTALENELLQLQGNTAELRARELAALEPANRALQERINALQDAQGAADAAGALRDAWQSVGDTIADEVKRIRGLNAAQATTLAGAQAQFAIATAKARAGDQSAAQSLPELSRTVLEMAAAGATSAQQLTLVRSQVAASLSQTADLVRAVGDSEAAAAEQRLEQLKTAGVSTTTALTATTAEVVAPTLAATTSLTDAAAADQKALLSELVALREELVGLRDESRATASYTAKISRLHTDWDGRGLLVRTEADQPLATVPA